MTRFKTLTLLAAAGLVAGVAQADIVWTGAVDGDIANDGNYDFSSSGLTTVAGIESGTLADSLVFNNSGVAPTLNEAAFQPTWGVAVGNTITFDGVVAGTDGNDGWGFGDASVINGADVTTFFFNTSAVSIDATSTVTLLGGGNPLAADATVDLAVGASVHFTNEDIAAFNSEHLSKFTVNGAALVDGVNGTVVSDGAAGTIVTGIVPEPGSLALLGLGGLLIARRRCA